MELRLDDDGMTNDQIKALVNFWTWLFTENEGCGSEDLRRIINILRADF